MLKSLHKMSLRTRLVLLTAVSILALLIALLSAWRTARTSDAFARRQAETSASNAVRDLLREARDYPNGRTDLSDFAASGKQKKPLPPHEREIYARYTEPFARSAAIALHRFPETVGGFCQADGQVKAIIGGDDFGANLSAEERAAAENLCREINASADFIARQTTVGGKFMFASAAPASFEGDERESQAGAISGAFVFRILPASSGLGDWFNLLTQAFLVASVVGLAAFSFLTWRDWQSGMQQIETGLESISNDLKARIDSPPMPELEQISGSINNLAANLDENLRRRKELENSLIRNEKLAALGRVVAGVAHEVRNPLASMKLKMQLAARNKFEPAKLEKTFGVLQEEIERLDNLVKKLLDVARPARLNFSTFDLIELIERRISLINENAVAQGVIIEFDKSNRNAEILADRERLAQVLDNLFRNALEAMPAGGNLKIALAPESNFYRVEISDEGKGFSDDERERLFEPFFTTKDKGTGLGLTISREIVEAHGGKIYLLSAAEKGAAFAIELPFSDFEN